MPFKSLLFYSLFKKSVRDKQLFCDLDKAAKYIEYIEMVAKKNLYVQVGKKKRMDF